ncbi:hypothetical protein [uncultured Nostoc sp.]|uniref:hypothetical protein n=1 Tax=uncultured Nostoc sp. TaxID=340711 RepID=UPI0035CAC871
MNNKELLQVSKEEFVVNVIALGIAVDLLSNFSPFTREEWASYIANKANSQLDGMSKETIEHIIKTHHSKIPSKNSHSISELDLRKAVDAENN